MNNALWGGPSSQDMCACGSLLCSLRCLQLHRRRACKADRAKRLSVDVLRNVAGARQMRLTSGGTLTGFHLHCCTLRKIWVLRVAAA